ncbi:MAG: tetratricopeptide repeat protein [Methanothrix sp.]|nr:tetratricopeptide repeat protein [Methanothrix sp.]
MQSMKLILVAFLILLLMGPVHGQQTAEDWFNKGNDFYDNGSYDLAIKCYDEVILIDPNLATAWNNKGYALYSQGKYDEAIRAYDRSL